MDVRYINPFVDSVFELFAKMLKCRVERGTVGVNRPGPAPSEITAVMGLAGSIRGTVTLTFPVPTALELMARLTGHRTKIVDEFTCDAVAEMVNIVSGGAKARLVAADDVPVKLGLPAVVRGADYQVVAPTGAVWLDIPFSSDIGPFRLRVTLADGPAGGSPCAS